MRLSIFSYVYWVFTFPLLWKQRCAFDLTGRRMVALKRWGILKKKNSGHFQTARCSITSRINIQKLDGKFCSMPSQWILCPCDSKYPQHFLPPISGPSSWTKTATPSSPGLHKGSPWSTTHRKPTVIRMHRALLSRARPHFPAGSSGL